MSQKPRRYTTHSASADDLRARNPLLHRREAQAYLGISRDAQTLARWAVEGKGPAFFKVANRAMYRRSDLDAWLEAQRVGPAPDAAA